MYFFISLKMNVLQKLRVTFFFFQKQKNTLRMACCERLFFQKKSKIRLLIPKIHPKARLDHRSAGIQAIIGTVLRSQK
jgi:precorrin-2 methylase